MEDYYHRMWGQLSTTCSNALKQPNGELLVAVNHNQLQTMASETVDPIDWSHPRLSWAVPPERLVHSINQCNLSGNRTCNHSMRGNHLAYAATQGIIYSLFSGLFILYSHSLYYLFFKLITFKIIYSLNSLFFIISFIFISEY